MVLLAGALAVAGVAAIIDDRSGDRGGFRPDEQDPREGIAIERDAPPAGQPDGAPDVTGVPEAAAEGGELEPAEGQPLGDWRELPPSPLPPGSVAGSVWTGDELLIWSLRELDGAAYDPERNAWRDVARIPGGAGGDAGWAWSGEEVLLVRAAERPGGSNGSGEALAYDPAGDAWRGLASLPPGEWRWETAVWNDGKLLIVGATRPDPSGDAVPAAIAYDPSADEWRELPRPPVWSRTGRIQTAAVGGHAIVVGHVRTATGDETRRAITAYDHGSGQWTHPEPAPLDGLWSVGIAAVPADGQVAMVGAVQSGSWQDVTATWSPDAGLEWDALPRRRVWGQQPPHLEPTSHGLLLWAPGAEHRWLLDESERRWRPLAQAPLGAREGMAVAWTGNELLVWGGRGAETGLRDDGAAWRPEP